MQLNSFPDCESRVQNSSFSSAMKVVCVRVGRVLFSCIAPQSSSMWHEKVMSAEL